MAVPVRYAGNPEGAIVYELGFQDLMALIVPMDQGFTNALLSGDRKVLHSSNKDFAVVGAALSNAQDSLWAMAAARLPGFPEFTFVSGELKEKAFAPVTRMRRFMFAAIILSILFVITGIFATAYFTTRPVQRFIEGIQHIQATKQLGYRMKPFGAAEFQTLTLSFNDMLDQIENTTTSRDELAIEVDRRRQANEELNRFKQALDSTLDMIFMFDPESLRFQYFNQGAVSTTGYSPDELVRMRPFDLRPSEGESEFRSQIVPLLSGEDRSLKFETVHRRKNGDDYPVEVTLQLVKTGNARVFIAMLRDITERKKIERMKNEFVSTVSHELRTPLTSIMGSLGLLRGGAVGILPDKAAGMIDIAFNNSERLVRLINDILDIEKIESGNMSFDLQPNALAPLVRQAVEVNHPYARKFGVTFALSVERDDVKVNMDPDKIMQVLTNLISNAVKFSPPRSQVKIAANAQGSSIRVAVIDEGPGVPEEFQDRIFGKFAQADASDARQKGGTGLGLSICKAIIDRHAGTIGFETTEGEGTVFYFELPITAEEPRTAPGAPSASIERKRILVRQDDPDAAQALEAMLRDAGFEVDIASSAGIARERLHDGDYGALMLDLGLQDQDGFSLLRELRADKRTEHLPVIIVSAQAEKAAGKAEGRALGIFDWLTKPVDKTRLVSVVGRILRLSHAGPPRILHVEDDEDVLSVVAAAIGETAELSSATTLEQAKDILAQEDFDLVLLDLTLPDGDGESLIPILQNLGPPAPSIILFSAQELPTELSERVSAALVKSRTRMEDLLATIERYISTPASEPTPHLHS